MKMLDYIFTLFSPANYRDDTYKDADGKGVLQRYNEVIGSDIDDNILPYIDNLVSATNDLSKMSDEFLSYREYESGVDLYLGSDRSTRESVLRYFPYYVSWKGTPWLYKRLFQFKGYGATITPTYDDSGGGFDSIYTFDSIERTFDNSSCYVCSGLVIELTGDGDLTGDDYSIISSIVNFNTPINVVLSTITYNGANLTIEYPSALNDWQYYISGGTGTVNSCSFDYDLDAEFCTD